MTEQAQIETPAPPATPAEAAARLDQLRANPEWTDALLSGGPAHVREFHELHELVAKGDAVDLAMAGGAPPGIMQDGAQIEMAGTADMLKGIGFTPLMIRETLSGKEATQVDVDLATKWKADHFSDAEWVKSLFSGNAQARRELLVANVILASPLKKEKA